MEKGEREMGRGKRWKEDKDGTRGVICGERDKEWGEMGRNVRRKVERNIGKEVEERRGEVGKMMDEVGRWVGEVWRVRQGKGWERDKEKSGKNGERLGER